MTRHTQWRLRSAGTVTALCVAVSLAYDAIDSGGVSWIAVTVGIGLALPLVLLEETDFDRRLRSRPFSAALLARTFAYLGSVVAVFMSMTLVGGYLQGLTMADYWAFLASADFFRQVGTGFVVYLVIVFFRQLDRLLGPGVLLRYLSGRYHRPRREARIFMFLDLKSSTSLAERLGPEAYYNLVNECFRDLATPVLESSGEIYEYVGDEVVLTWTEERGLRNANCLRVYFDFTDRLATKREAYLQRFGVVPEFKAGVHVGEVVTAEIGDLKKSLVFNGDVLNTGSRIQGQCGELGKRLLASSHLVERLTLPPEWQVEDMGEVSLRGKHAPVRLLALA